MSDGAAKTFDTSEPILQYFAYEHLPPHLQEVSRPFGEMAAFIVTQPRNAERTVALRKLLESKDAAVRAKLAKPVQPTAKREITSHKVNECNEALKIHVLDQPGSGGACHEYALSVQSEKVGFPLVTLKFQNGPIKEVGTNGITHEALLAILEDRLQSFQNGPYACSENATALTYIQCAQNMLKSRTTARMNRGVEGTHQL